MMAKSELAIVMDALQERLTPLLRQAEFRKSGRTYNRTTSDGLTHVVGFQMGLFDPPGMTYFPGLRENLYGLFAINLGVYVPEVARTHGGGEAKAVVRDYNCCIRTRLGQTLEREFWWEISAKETLVSELQERLSAQAFPFFQRFKSRDQVLDELDPMTGNTDLVHVPRIVRAIILVNRGACDVARRLLSDQVGDNGHMPGHVSYVRELAERLGIPLNS